jgi:ankyrin repeat protein
MILRLCCCGSATHKPQDTVAVGGVSSSKPSIVIPGPQSGSSDRNMEPENDARSKRGLNLKTNSVRPEATTSIPSIQHAWSESALKVHAHPGKYPLFPMNSMSLIKQEQFEQPPPPTIAASEFFKVAKKGTLEEVQTLLSAPGVLAHLDARGMWESTPLIVACQNARSNVAIALLDAGAAPQLLNERGNSALLFACVEGMNSVCERLLDSGASAHSDPSSLYCEVTDSVQRLTPLSAAALTGNADLVEVLLKRGALLEGHASPDNLSGERPQGEGNVLGPLRCATISNNLRTLEMLLDDKWIEMCRNEIQHVNQQGNSLAHEIIQSGADPLILEAVLNQGATIDLRNKLGETCLLLAVRADRLALVQLLLSHGANPNVDDVLPTDVVEAADSLGGRTALMEACSNGSIECARALLDAGACVSTADKHGTTALQIAQAEEHDVLVDMLKSRLSNDQEEHSVSRVT